MESISSTCFTITGKGMAEKFETAFQIYHYWRSECAMNEESMKDKSFISTFMAQ